MSTVLSRNWWAVAVRGACALLLGLFGLLVPGVTLVALIWLFGAYALVDGVFAIIASVRAAERHERWWPTLLEGVAGVLAGLLTFAWPGMTAILLVYMIGGWAVVTGVLKIVAAVRLRRSIRGELIFILNGIISVVFGLFLLALPAIGIIAIVWWVAGYAMFRGLMLIALGFRLRHHHRAHPVGGHS